MPPVPSPRSSLARLAVLTAGALLSACQIPLPPKTPAQAEVSERQWLDQGWSDSDRHWYHHADQGTANFVIPYDWFLVLEQPGLNPLRAYPPVSDPDYVQGFGFIPSRESERFNPDGLPVGFIKSRDQVDPVTNRVTDQVGLTCAACHTGRLSYQGRELFIDGGAAIAGVTDYTKAVGMAVLYTDFMPGRYGRFERALLGPDAGAGERAALEADFAKYVAQFKYIAALTGIHQAGSVNEGYGRLDALDRIGNQVFAIAAGKPHNFVATAAPVAYPHIWMAPWFTWVQYDASIMQPMVRNAGEALGVAAPINLRHPGPEQYRSAVKMDELEWMERLLSGEQHPHEAAVMPGLRAPDWPEAVLGDIDQALAARGQGLYERHCQSCHLPPTTTPAFLDSPRWRPIQYDPAEPRRVFPYDPARDDLARTELAYLDLKVIDAAQIGTDPAQWQSLARRSVDVSGLNLEETLAGFPGVTVSETGQAPFGYALAALVERAIDDWAARQQPPVTGAARRALDGNRPNQIQAPEGYKARPLDGVWATPPYLHNGSIPSIYALLSPQAERPEVFWLGSHSYDPVHLGYEYGELAHATRIDTTLPGNRNTGHLFDHGYDPSRPKAAQAGLIGPYLEPGERLALIEFLKTQ